jgi:hypothetical protein
MGGETTAGFTGAAAAGLTGDGGAGLPGAAGAAAAGFAGTGFTGAGAAGATAAFLRVTMVLAGAGAAAAEPFPPFSSSWRIRAASSSLMELLWLLAATPSFSAASSTSLFSRPRSRDSS